MAGAGAVVTGAIEADTAAIAAPMLVAIVAAMPAESVAATQAE
jgi:acetyltransferase-like isoleucine patch superfamily enzyme